MPEDIIIDNTPPIEAKISLQSGKWAIILAPGEENNIDKGIIPSLMKKLAEKDISSLSFKFPVKVVGDKQSPSMGELESIYLRVWEYANQEYSQYQWVLAGLGIGAEIAIRSTSLILTEDGSIPPIVALNYPLYPPNKPERVNASSLGAVMGDTIFIQAEHYNRGTFTRLRNQVQMMAPHADVKRIGNARGNFEVPEKSFNRVAFWISNDIEQFLKNVN